MCGLRAACQTLCSVSAARCGLQCSELPVCVMVKDGVCTVETCLLHSLRTVSLIWGKYVTPWYVF